MSAHGLLSGFVFDRAKLQISGGGLKYLSLLSTSLIFA
jgi:hypothetical protein